LAIEVGNVFEGRVTGVKPFGAFVALPEGRVGMVHISEVSNEFVQDIAAVLHDGDIGENDVDLTEFIVESIMFISFIVELEDKLGIEIPEELLDINSIKSLNTFSTILEELLK